MNALISEIVTRLNAQIKLNWLDAFDSSLDPFSLVRRVFISEFSRLACQTIQLSDIVLRYL